MALSDRIQKSIRFNAFTIVVGVTVASFVLMHYSNPLAYLAAAALYFLHGWLFGVTLLNQRVLKDVIAAEQRIEEFKRELEQKKDDD